MTITVKWAIVSLVMAVTSLGLTNVLLWQTVALHHFNPLLAYATFVTGSVSIIVAMGVVGLTFINSK
jgi:hypothetical protein